VKRDDPLEHSFEVFEMVPGRLGGPHLHQKIEILTRKTLVYRIMSEEQMPPILDEIKAALPAEPMIFIRYNPAIPDFMNRLHAVANPEKVILRAEPVASVSMPVGGVMGEQPESEDIVLKLRKPVDLIPAFFPGNTDLAKLAERICDPNAQTALLINQYVDDKLARA
jgi:hypothetical protein